ncbi:MAG: hypothetical protein JXB42_12830 [Deltaproteobacteria bacterium]|nr:hypothetical protein [Deltaproteobacteria bacterium]
MKAGEKVTKARAGLILDQPFFASLALRLRVEVNESRETMSTDGKVLAYNSAFVNALPLDQLKGCIAHETMHLACCHHTRRGEREPKKWNVACDYAINQILVDSGMALPDGALIDPAFTGMSADEIYNRIPDCPPESGNDPGGCGEIDDFKGPEGKEPSPAEVAQEEQNWKISVVQATQQAKAMGELPGGLERLVSEIVEPKVNWREVLRRFVDQSAKNDYTWTRPNRRYMHSGLYLPALYSNELPPIVIAIDTSGSIDDDLVNQFATEVNAILQDHKTTCNVLYCDTRICGVESFTSDDLPIKFKPKGGGGTDFRPPFEWVDKQGITPACLIYLTDMYCHRFPEPPGYPVLWAKTEDYGNAPFGEEVRVS